MGIETFDYQHVLEIGFPYKRKPEAKLAQRVPPGTTIISSDNHWSLSEDIFYERFPEHLRDRAPRVWQEDGAWHIGMDGKSMLPRLFSEVFATFDGIPGSTDIEARMRDLDIEGIEKEVVFGNAVGVLLAHPDSEIRELCFRIYNEYLAENQAKWPGRFYGVGIPIWWDIEKFKTSIKHIKALGLKTFLLPNTPGKNLEGDEIIYQSDEMRPFWEAVEEVGLPVCFHIGETFSDGGRSGVPISTMLNLAGLRKPFSQLLFGGVYDRHPTLRTIFVEGGILWAVSCLHDAEIVYSGQAQMSEWKLAHPPRYYWQKHCYTTFMSDPGGLEMIDYVGADTVLWSSDYPHLEGVYGYGWKAIQEVLSALNERDASMVLGGTAQKLFDL